MHAIKLLKHSRILRVLTQNDKLTEFTNDKETKTSDERETETANDKETETSNERETETAKDKRTNLFSFFYHFFLFILSSLKNN